MQILQLFYEQFLQLYMALPTNFDDLAKRDAVLQEHLVYSASTKATYKGLAAQALGKLKKRPKAAGLAEGVGTNEALQSSKAKQVAVSKAALSMQQLQRYTLDKYAEERWKKDFILEIPPGISAPVTEAGNIRACSRCEANFLVKNQIDKAELIECPHHWVSSLVADAVQGLNE
jgi:RNA exonuclease 1